MHNYNLVLVNSKPWEAFSFVQMRRRPPRQTGKRSSGEQPYLDRVQPVGYSRGVGAEARDGLHTPAGSLREARPAVKVMDRAISE